LVALIPSAQKLSMAYLRALRLRLRRIVSSDRPTLQIGYAIPVDEDIHNAMRRLQLRLLRAYGWDICLEESPHITLKQGFLIQDPEPFERYFDRLVREVEPFDIQTGDIGFFDDGIVYLDVAPSTQLHALRGRLLRDLSEAFGVTPNPLEDDRYRFHATIAHSLPRASLDQARRNFRSEPVSFRFHCNALTMLLHTGRQWITYKSSSLLSQSRGVPTVHHT
jgi:2'-5' RNA ligase